MTAARRGWREKVAPGVYRSHRVACPSTLDRRPRRRCDCPYAVAAPSGGRQARWITVDGSLPDARRVLDRARADVGTVAAAAPGGGETLHDFTAAWFRAKAPTLRPATVEAYERAYRLRIAPLLGAERLDALTRERLEEWVAALLGGGRVVDRPLDRGTDQALPCVLPPGFQGRQASGPATPAKKRRPADTKETSREG